MAGETIADFVAELRKLTTHCKFEDTMDVLDESLCDRFVCGPRSESVRKHLFKEEKLTFAKAVDLAQTLETASKDAQDQVPGGNSAVHKVTSPFQKEGCSRCGLTNHKSTDCRFKESTCHSCGKKGHIKPIRVEVRVNGKPLSMEVDTSAGVSLISYRKLKQVLATED